MKQVLFIFVTLLSSVNAFAVEHPLWMRHPAISPNGKVIAFSYKGDLFTVSSKGGEAYQLTPSDTIYDANPVWSPDGKKIAFASRRKGSTDVWVMDVNEAGQPTSGAPKRLTTNSGHEYPVTFLDNSHVLYTTHIMPTQNSLLCPSRFNEVYCVSTDGGRPTIFSGLDMCDIDILRNPSTLTQNSSTVLLYHDHKGVENEFRKHQQSAIARDIWILKDGKYTKLTTFKGEDRTPRWSRDGNSFYYLSESDGTFNVYRQGIDGSTKTQLTQFTKNPVRCLTVSDNDELCFWYNGDIYTLNEKSGQPKKVNITIKSETKDDELIKQVKKDGATEIAVSPDNKSVAFIIRGDIYLINTDTKETKQITDTPEQERNISFSPDGKNILYASERNGLWQIYHTNLASHKEERLVKSDQTSQQPHYSPDGTKIAFVENRSTLKVLDLKTKTITTCLNGKFMYSVKDGDPESWLEWSPDSKWLLCPYIGDGGWHNQDVAVVSATGDGKIHNITNSGYNEMIAHWAKNGKTIIFESDRDGDRPHGSWGSSDDIYMVPFDPDFKHSPLSSKLTVYSTHISDMWLTESCDTLYYLTATKGAPGFWTYEGQRDLWMQDIKNKTTKMLVEGTPMTTMRPSPDGKSILLCGDKTGIQRYDIASGKVTPVNFEVTFNYRPHGERKYIFEHFWQEVKDKFYDPQLHGADWNYYRENYAKFLPHINNDQDFNDMMSEMLGELNGSHTGGRSVPPKVTAKPTAYLGLFFDDDYQGDGLKIKEVIKNGPCDQNSNIKSGDIISAIDGTIIKAGEDYYPLFEDKVDKDIKLSVYNPETKHATDVTVKSITLKKQDALLYDRWVDRCEKLVDSLSHNRLAYVHIKSMTSQYFREVYRRLLNEKNRNRESVIVDERNNGGGWLHDDLCLLLSGKNYMDFIAHGQYIGREPYSRWCKPSCVIMNENAYSDGSLFPTAYRELGIGKLIGTPVAGTGTAVWWETQLNPDMYFGIPEVGCHINAIIGKGSPSAGQFSENHEIEPDIEVYNTPEDILSGHDAQLEAAIKEMLK